MKNLRTRKEVIEATKCPLGFYILSLLIVEAMITCILVFSGLEAKYKLICFLTGIGLFVLVLVIVTLMAWFKPHSLTYNGYAHLLDTGKIPWGTDQEQIPYSEIQKPESSEEKK